MKLRNILKTKKTFEVKVFFVFNYFFGASAGLTSVGVGAGAAPGT